MAIGTFKGMVSEAWGHLTATRRTFEPEGSYRERDAQLHDRARSIVDSVESTIQGASALESTLDRFVELEVAGGAGIPTITSDREQAMASGAIEFDSWQRNEIRKGWFEVRHPDHKFIEHHSFRAEDGAKVYQVIHRQNQGSGQLLEVKESVTIDQANRLCYKRAEYQPGPIALF